MSLSQTWAAFKLLHLSKPAGDRLLYKSVQGHTIASVLEINIASWQRTVQLIGWLRRQGNTGPIRYAAIDLFEMAETQAPIALKEFHQRLSALGVKPLPIPGTAIQGLPRVANTLGAIDLVILEIDDQQLADPLLRAQLGRITHQNSIVLARSSKDALVLLPSEQFHAGTAAIGKVA